MPVDDERRVRLLLAEDEVHGAAHLGKRGRIERRLAIDRREASGGEQLVAGAERDFEHAREMEHEVAARPGAPGLDEARVPGREAGLGGEPELAHLAPFAPLPEQRSDRALLPRLHRAGSIRSRTTIAITCVVVAAATALADHAAWGRRASARG